MLLFQEEEIYGINFMDLEQPQHKDIQEQLIKTLNF